MVEQPVADNPGNRGNEFLGGAFLAKPFHKILDRFPEFIVNTFVAGIIDIAALPLQLFFHLKMHKHIAGKKVNGLEYFVPPLFPAYGINQIVISGKQLPMLPIYPFVSRFQS